MLSQASRYDTKNRMPATGGESLVSALLEIQENKFEQGKDFGFVKRLEVLVHPVQTRKYEHDGEDDELLFRRREINAFKNDNYLALSYTWRTSVHEGETCSQRYRVERQDGGSDYSDVRDCVLDRITNYMRCFNLEHLWIDRHCIEQGDCKEPECGHKKCDKKRTAVHTMDLVYKLSRWPVSLLGRPITTEDELDLLAQIIDGELLQETGGQDLIIVPLKRQEVRQAICLLYEIVDDLWWTRAWTFQENYRAGTKMTLLIRHPPDLEGLKQEFADLFTDNDGYNRPTHVTGELCINSAKFSERATELCQAAEKELALTKEETDKISRILDATGRYQRRLQKSECMSPLIVSDIQRRGITDNWDRLAIIANCCQYSKRLGSPSLTQKDSGLEVSILCMCLINGEVLDNRRRGSVPTPTQPTSVAEFLRDNLFSRFDGPDHQYSLTFNKSCRLVNPILEHSGIATWGHLWKLSPNLIHTHTGAFSKQHVPYIKPWKVCKRLGLKGYQNLLKLVGVLRLKGYHTLADSVEDLLQEWVGHQGSSEGGELLAFSQKHMRNMAIAVANAIGCKLPLRLGCLVDPDGSEQEYSAIFVWDNEKAKSLPQTSFAFTAARGSSSGSSVDYANDIDRHVSLEVDAECLTDGRRPELRIKSWRNGLYFVSVWQREVLFPWPASFQSFTGFTSSDIVS